MVPVTKIFKNELKLEKLKVPIALLRDYSHNSMRE